MTFKIGQDGSGKCDVVESVLRGAQVHGVIYEIPASEKPRLDKAEGLGAGYEEKQVVVETSAGRISALVYYATKIDVSLTPFTWYKALVVAGAREHALPAEYVAALAIVPAQYGSDIGRAEKHFALVASG